LQNPELFPDQLVIDKNTSHAENQTLEIAMKALTHI
jgi:hypothetical protein